MDTDQPVNEYEVALDHLTAELAQKTREVAVLVAKLASANQREQALRAQLVPEAEPATAGSSPAAD